MYMAIIVGNTAVTEHLKEEYTCRWMARRDNVEKQGSQSPWSLSRFGWAV